MIESGSLRLTWLSGIAAAVVAAAAVFTDDFFDGLLGDAPPAGARAAVFIAVVAAWALIAVADLLARGYASAHASNVVAAPGRLPTATWTKGTDQEGFLVAALKVGGGAVTEYLIVKADAAPRWVPATELELEGSQRSAAPGGGH